MLLIAALAVCADQLTKVFIYGHDSAFIKGVIRFASVENRGVAWGFLNGTNGALIFITVFTAIATGLLIFVAVKYRKYLHPAVAIPLACVIGGAIGNLIDRVVLGCVRDFICTEFISFPVFNVADCFVTVGGITLAAVLLFSKPGKEFVKAVFPEENKKKDA
ncbi:MAG: signal peptidase II [Clostridiales bacterium]|nr:signal peptidase II [Clostridiales bacterium]